MSYDSCRLAEDELAVLESIMQQPQMKGEGLQQTRLRTSQTPKPLDEARVQALAGYELNVDNASVVKPRWLSKLAWNRDEFEGCAFRIVSGTHINHYLFLVGIQNPFEAIFALMDPHPEPEFEPWNTSTPDQWRASGASWLSMFEVSFEKYLDWTGLATVDNTDVSIMRGLT